MDWAREESEGCGGVRDGGRKGTLQGPRGVISIVRSLIACVISRIILRVNSKF
jgi:hypothetical protein